MRVALGADHAGFRLKEAIRHLLDDLKVPYEDVGTDSEQAVDYPDIAAAVARLVASGRVDRGILMCGTGIGMSMAANKVAGVRAALAPDEESARLSRAHNDANVLTLAGRLTPPEVAVEIVRLFLTTPFDGGRHQQRVDKIMALDRAEPGPDGSITPGAGV